MPSDLDASFLDYFGLRLERSNLNSTIIWISEKSDMAILPFVRSRITGELRVKRISSVIDSSIDDVKPGKTSSHSHSHSLDSRDPAKKYSPHSAVTKLNDLIAQCLGQRASDIHIEPREDGLHCRARIDGVLSHVETVPKDKVAEVLSRLKIMAGLDIAEKRRPQDGRIRFGHEDRKVDIRVSVIPTEFGEKAVLRLLDKSTLRLNLYEIGFSDQEFTLFKEKISLPNGIILVTGPTGSGKTTTLYAALSHLKSAELNISTVEDPIEYNLDGINQTHIRSDIGVSFAAMLRALLRQDPNIIMVGEIRDAETLDMAIRASLTGHLVFSTLHTNDAPSTITRLLNMGADPVVLASSLKLVVAQRLVRRLCEHCNTANLSDVEVAASQRLNLNIAELNIRSSTGCARCRHTGYLGRQPIFEMLPITSEIANAISERGSDDRIRTLGCENGFKSLLDNALSLVRRQVTTPSEILREVQA